MPASSSSLLFLSSHQENISFSRNWAWLALLAIGLSGVAPLILIAGRASIYADMTLVKEWFAPVLVVHVNLSVGLWFLAMGMIINYSLIRCSITRMIQQAAALCFFLTVVLMALAPLAEGEAFTSNYIPVQNNPLFFVALSLLFVSLLCMASVFVFCNHSYESSLPNLLGSLNALTLLVVLSAFMFSVIQHPAGYGGESYYEAIFWGGGHLLQIFYVQLGMTAWLILADILKIPHPPTYFIKILFYLLWANALAALGIYLFFDVNEYYHIKLFTWQMNCITGPLPGILALWYVIKMYHAQWRLHKPIAGCFIMSLTLFLVGGALGYLIEGSNVTIPAHYHGSTVGITLALMGVFLALLPKFKAKECKNSTIAIIQPWIYGIGQILHVVGLAVAGGHNIARKTAGALDSADQAAAIALQVMRLGGILAVIGGGVFVILAIKSLCGSRC